MIPTNPPAQLKHTSLFSSLLEVYSTEGWAFPGSEWVFPAADSKSGHVAETREQRREKLINVHSLRRTLITFASDVVPRKHISFLVNHNVDKETITDQYIVRNSTSLHRSQQLITDYLVGRLGYSVEEILGPERNEINPDFGWAAPWKRKARGKGGQKTSLHL